MTPDWWRRGRRRVEEGEKAPEIDAIDELGLPEENKSDWYVR
jgi:hypothetical protein